MYLHTTLGVLSRCRMTLWRLLVTCVSRLRARFQGLQIQWLSSPLGAEGPARLRAGPTLPGNTPKDVTGEGHAASPGDGGRCHSREVRGWALGTKKAFAGAKEAALWWTTGFSRGLDPMAAVGGCSGQWPWLPASGPAHSRCSAKEQAGQCKDRYRAGGGCTGPWRGGGKVGVPTASPAVGSS